LFESNVIERLDGQARSYRQPVEPNGGPGSDDRVYTMRRRAEAN